MIPGCQDFVSLKIGQKFIEPPPFDLAGSFKDSTATGSLVSCGPYSYGPYAYGLAGTFQGAGTG